MDRIEKLIQKDKCLLGELLRAAVMDLKDMGNEAPAVDVGVMLCHCLHRDRVFLYAHPEYEVTHAEIEQFAEMLDARAGGMPVAYIVGEKEFMSLRFAVGTGVLVPRPETELLVEHVVDRLRSRAATAEAEAGKIDACQTVKNVQKLCIADLGTGSGCIAVSLAHALHDAEVYAVDISRKALNYAEKNVMANGVEKSVVLQKKDMFEFLNEMPGKFDAIVSNPPYITANEMDGLMEDVRCFEPHTALYGGEDGLDYYRRLVNEAFAALKPGGLLAVEVGARQARDVAALIFSAPEGAFDDICCLEDLQGHERVVSAIRK